jgi:hypothetical protein
LNFSKLESSVFKNLKNGEIRIHNDNKKLIGLYSYNILDNPRYQTRFMYFPAFLEGREYLINDRQHPTSTKQSDLVKAWFNRFYISEKAFKEMYM